MSDLQSPFNNAACDTPSGAATGTGATTGGFDLGDGSQKETPNSSGLPLLQTLADVTGGPSRGTPIVSPVDQNVHTIDKQ